MCFFFFFSHFSFFILFTNSLHTLWPRYLQTCIKGSCISFLSTFLQNYSWNSKIPSKSAASAEKKCKQQWQNGGILNWYSPRKKTLLSTISRLCFHSQKKCHAFSSNLETWISIFFPSLSTPGDTSWRYKFYILIIYLLFHI